MAEMTDAQRRAYEAAIARRQEREAKVARAPRERVRTLAQGLTLGFSDEAEAGVRSFFGSREYEDLLNEIRGNLKGYQEARPGEAAAYEIGGALIPAAVAVAAAPFTGGTSTAAVAPTMGRLTGMAALEGGAYAFGTGEGGLIERAKRIPGGATTGAVGGVVGGTATRAAGGALTALTGTARRIAGGRGSSAVENEIQRLVRQTGKTADQIADDILNGRLLAENKTIRAVVRATRTAGGDAATVLDDALTPRPAATRAQALQAIRGGLSDAAEPSALQAMRRSDDAARAAEDLAYAPFDDIPAPDDVVDALADTLRRVPSASKEVEIALQAQTGAKPFFEILEDGSVQFSRPPTVAEAERIRRAVGNRATALYKDSMGGAGEAVAGVEKGLRGQLDDAVDGLGDVRAQAASIRSGRDAFDAGRKAVSKDPFESLMEFRELTDPSDIAAYRAGLMSGIEARATTGSRQSLIRNLANPETREGMLMREVFPQDQLDDVLYKIETASEAQDTFAKVLHGSQTSEDIIEQTRRGLGISVADMTGVLSMNPDSLINVASNLASKFTRDLTDAERARVARILVSDDAALVRRAILDESAMAKLQERIQQISVEATKGVRRAGTAAAAPTGGDISQGLLSFQ